MDINELLDDDAFDPKKLFDEKKYSTLIINREGYSKKENSAADLIEGLLEPNITRSESEEIFKKLKDNGSTGILVEAIKNAGRIEEKRILTAACWESGLDFSKDFLFFVQLATSADFQLAMEAITVVENCEEPIDAGTLHSALDIAVNSKQNNESLSEDLIANIRLRMK